VSGRDQALVDTLQAAIPRLQLAVRSAEQQHQDVAAALDAVARAVTLLQPRPTHHPGTPHITNLEIAALRRVLADWEGDVTSRFDDLTPEEWSEVERLQATIDSLPNGHERLAEVMVPMVEARIRDSHDGKPVAYMRRLFLEALREAARRLVH
jgi:hypothetical protein